jgi:hypothetical protein
MMQLAGNYVNIQYIPLLGKYRQCHWLKKHEKWKIKGECVKQYKINANGGGICKGYNFF